MNEMSEPKHEKKNKSWNDKGDKMKEDHCVRWNKNRNDKDEENDSIVVVVVSFVAATVAMLR